MMIRTLTATLCFCLALALPAFTDDKKPEKKKAPTGENFSNMDLTKMSFKERNFKDNSTFEDSDCKGVSFFECIAKQGVFAGADLTQADMRKADLTGADFRKAKLEFTNFSAAILTDANFEAADLSSAVFYVTTLRGANLRNLKGIDAAKYCKFQGADLRGANLSKMVVGTTKDQHPNFTKARYDKDTRWPAGFDPVDAGAVLVAEVIKK